jgi:hypothetical protein
MATGGKSTAEDEYRKIIIEHLAGLKPQLVAKLREITTSSVPKDVASMSFEVFSDGFYERFPVYAYALDNENTEVTFDQPFSGYVLPEAKPVFPEAHEKVEELYSERGVETWDVATDELIKCFHHCWLEAGGRGAKYNASIQHHDSIHFFDLKLGRWSKGSD